MVFLCICLSRCFEVDWRLVFLSNGWGSHASLLVFLWPFSEGFWVLGLAIYFGIGLIWILFVGIEVSVKFFEYSIFLLYLFWIICGVALIFTYLGWIVGILSIFGFLWLALRQLVENMH
jgi:hypothetical protein